MSDHSQETHPLEEEDGPNDLLSAEGGDDEQEEEDGSFPHPFSEYDQEKVGPAITLVELKMLQLSYALRSKPSWWTKYKNSEIRAKWRAEALAHDVDGKSLTEAEVDYVLDELEGYDEMRDAETGIQHSCFARIYESDSLISAELCQKLKATVSKLDDVPDEEKDWHPRANGMVLDLVHPSLYCLVYGRTLSFVPAEGEEDAEQDDVEKAEEETASEKEAKDHKLQITDGPCGDLDDWAYSSKFAWIPTDFNLNAAGEPATALSYINNIHPDDTDLVEIIERLVGRFGLLWQRVLTDLQHEGELPFRITGGYDWKDDGGEPKKEEGEDWDAFDTKYNAWKEQQDITLSTVPAEGYTQHVWAGFEPYELGDCKIQVIVKLANHHLTPEKPSYAGGSWHVEGMANERIVASGIYYYDSENVEDNYLAFRTAVSPLELDYEQNDELGTRKTWGLDRDSQGNQNLGSVKTFAGRCIAFPNIYQHQVSPFSLIDKTKSGHRKIVALFLVDPTIEIPSTSNIPPQQAEWIRAAMNAEGSESLFSKLPVELLDLIVQETGTMTLEEAKKYREELMDERTAFVGTQNEQYFATEWNMCEH